MTINKDYIIGIIQLIKDNIKEEQIEPLPINSVLFILSIIQVEIENYFEKEDKND